MKPLLPLCLLLALSCSSCKAVGEALTALAQPTPAAAAPARPAPEPAPVPAPASREARVAAGILHALEHPEMAAHQLRQGAAHRAKREVAQAIDELLGVD